MTAVQQDRAETTRVVTTIELMELLVQGKKVRLPRATIDSEQIAAHYDADELARLDLDARGSRVVSVEYVRADQVQCIRVADERHLYLTDDFIPTHNTTNMIFLKSTDDTMIDNLSKISGTTHRGYTSTKTFQRNAENLAMKTDANYSLTMSLEERAVISTNDLYFLPERNSIVFAAGEAPIWNRNATALPMSYMLFGGNVEKTIRVRGQSYSVKTLPTLSSAKEFEVRKNQPNFYTMVEKRVLQATQAPAAEALYRAAYDLDDFKMGQLDPDVSSAERMDINDVLVMRKLHESEERKVVESGGVSVDVMDMYGVSEDDKPVRNTLGEDEDLDGLSEQEMLERAANRSLSGASDNVELSSEVAGMAATTQDYQRKRYGISERGDAKVSREMLVDYSSGQVVVQQIKAVLAAAYERTGRYFDTDRDFAPDGSGGLVLRAGGKPMIVSRAGAGEINATLDQLKEHERVRVESEVDDDSLSALAKFEVTDAFVKYLVSLDDWRSIAGGKFDKEVARIMQLQEVPED